MNNVDGCLSNEIKSKGLTDDILLLNFLCGFLFVIHLGLILIISQNPQNNKEQTLEYNSEIEKSILKILNLRIGTDLVFCLSASN